MFGSLAGNIIGIAYFLLFQVIGICFTLHFLRKEHILFRILMGSVLGSFALQWFPIGMAFFMGFTKKAHIAGVFLFLLFVLLFSFLDHKKNNLTNIVSKPKQASLLEVCKKHKIFWILIPTFFYFVIILLSHTIPIKDGAMYTGQATYGDMSMHLGFISSIAKQGTFPPEYSILPGEKLAYPFLCDSISSSIHVFGASLRISYLLPMFFAILQVFLGFYCFAYSWLKSATKALLAWVLFFYNGGFGFAYFFDQVFGDTTKFTNIFSGFYYTPTSLGDKNLRWAQIIVNMLVPQRATLFGWAILFPLLALLYKAIQKKERKYFWLAGIFAGGLPLIHTHSFMAVGLICAVWVMYELYQMAADKNSNKKSWGKSIRISITVGGLVFFSGLQIINQFITPIEKYCFGIVLAVVACIVLIVLYLLYMSIKKNGVKEIFFTWGVFLAIVVVFAVPQLLEWTFQQASSGNFVKGHFNWSNEGDQYIWFYVKNIGIMSLFALPALVYSRMKDFMTVAPAFAIWFVAELLVFQPNVYDNNKLLFVGFALVCCITAGYMIDIYKQWRISKSVAVGVLLVATISALLTMGREYTSGEQYEIYSANQVELSQFIEDTLPVDAVILTNTRHNNAVASLTGRNIVCGAGTFLFYHGLNYEGREQEVAQMYLSPGTTQDLLKKYNVSYILIGEEERSSYNELDEMTISSMYPCIYNENGIALYQVQ